VSIDIEVVEQQDPRLGRNKRHDTASRAFAVPRKVIDRSTWVDKSIRIYDPIPNPNQEIGCCTCVAKCIQLNASGNRKAGRVLKMPDAVRSYSRNTEIDPYDGTYPPTDTGSDGLASCQAAKEFGWAGEYQWEFGGADGVIQNIMEGRPMSLGTWWYWDMFDQDQYGHVNITGGVAGGHQYVARGYRKSRDWVLCRCWWGSYRDFWISRVDLDSLLRDGGDAHFQRTT
jgi:hypothetical protein